MINMGHARFENTYKALLECDEEIDSHGGEPLSDSEKRYRKKLFELMRGMEHYSYIVDEDDD